MNTMFFLFNWYWHQSVSLLYLKTDIIKLISTLEIIKNSLNQILGKLFGHFYSLNNYFKQILGKCDYFIYIRHLHSEIFFPCTILQYPWMLSQTIKKRAHTHTHTTPFYLNQNVTWPPPTKGTPYLICLVHDLNNLRW